MRTAIIQYAPRAVGLIVRKLSFLVFFILGMDFGGVAIELGSRGLDGELPVDLDRLGAALVEQGQHLSYRQSIRYHLGMQENLVYGLISPTASSV